ncbi:MAG TPA: DUF4398 domain-containing protein [Vicinamibacterales bacterium]|jgi:hypothetical protein
MPSVRCLLASVALVVSCSFACGGDPPTKEMQEAQVAIDTARAAGADRYAPEEYTAAEDSLKKAQDAVAQRDYRLALNYALDSRERAQNSAREAADHKAVARTDAQRAIASAAAALADAKAKLRSIEGPRTAAKAHAAEHRTIADADTAVQKARTAFARGEYLDVIETVKPLKPRLAGAMRDMDAAPAPPARRRR